MAALVCFAFWAGKPLAAQQDTEWKAGVASVVITPQQSMWMAGYSARKKPSEGKVNDLFAKALALEDEHGMRLVIVTMDLISVPRQLRDTVQQEAGKRYKLPPESLLLNCSHTHCGPVLRPRPSGIYPQDPERLEQVRAYRQELEPKLVELVGRALENLSPARLACSHARAGFAMNRRVVTERGVSGGANPDGPVDQDVPILRIDGTDGKLRAVLFGYACHNTTLGPDFVKFCGDYAGFVQQYLEEDHPGVTALFMAGCGGDQNPRPRPRDGTLRYVQYHGRALATAVEAALITGPRPVRGPLRIALEEVTLENRRTFTRLIRRWKADVVISHRTNDYHPDHRYTAVLVQDSAFMVSVPFFCPDTPRVRNPIFLHYRDGFRVPNPFEPFVAVALDEEAAQKKGEAMAVLDSQLIEGGCGGGPGGIPKDAADKERRRQRIRQRFKSGCASAAERYRDKLIELYGEEKGKQVRYAEVFGLSEHGRRPKPEELRRLFPFPANEQ